MSPEEQRQAIEAIRRALENRPAAIKILVVEDNHADAELTIQALQQFGLEVEWAKDRSEIEQVMRKVEPWLVLLDLKLHNESGIAMLNLVKQLNPQTRVVVLTGAYEHDSVECKLALTEGAIAVMLKPLRVEQIQLIFGAP